MLPEDVFEAVTIATFNKHLAQVLDNELKGIWVKRRQIGFGYVGILDGRMSWANVRKAVQ